MKLCLLTGFLVVELKNFRWQTDPKSKRFRGFAFVEFGNKGSYLVGYSLFFFVPASVCIVSSKVRKKMLTRF